MSIYVCMGVSGVGKTSVGKALGERLGGEFLDADDFHPAANKQKMAQGIPLGDDDRWGWLDALNQTLKARRAQHPERAIVLACSALKASYRARLGSGVPGIRFVYLEASYAVVQQRIAARRDHFMPASLLQSQFNALEEPSEKEAIRIDADAPIDVIVDRILHA